MVSRHVNTKLGFPNFYLHKKRYLQVHLFNQHPKTEEPKHDNIVYYVVRL